MRSLTMAAGSEGRDRHLFIGGSDAAGVLGVEPYGCTRYTFLSKVPVAAIEPLDETGPMERGKALEEVCARIFRKETGIKGVRKYRPGDERPAGNDAAKRHPWLHVHPDRVVAPLTDAQWLKLAGDIPQPEGPGYLEIKTIHSRMMPELDRGGVPLQHLLQVQHGALRLGYKWGVVQVTAADDWEHRRYVTVPTEEGLADYAAAGDALWGMVTAARDAWTSRYGHAMTPDGPDHRLDVPPAAWDEYAPARMDPKDKRCRKCPIRHECQGQALLDTINMPALGDEHIGRFHDDPAWGMAMAAYLKAQELAGEADAMKADARAQLEAMMEGRTVAEGGGARVYWRTQKSTRLDTTKLKKDHPDLAEKYGKVTVSRPFRVFPV